MRSRTRKAEIGNLEPPKYSNRRPSEPRQGLAAICLPTYIIKNIRNSLSSLTVMATLASRWISHLISPQVYPN